MSNTDTVALFMGFLMPPVIAFLTKEHWTAQVKGIVAFVICLIAAGATAWYEQTLNTHNMRDTIPLVFGAAIATYHWWWKPSGISDSVGKLTG